MPAPLLLLWLWLLADASAVADAADSVRLTPSACRLRAHLLRSLRRCGIGGPAGWLAG